MYLQDHSCFGCCLRFSGFRVVHCSGFLSEARLDLGFKYKLRDSCGAVYKKRYRIGIHNPDVPLSPHQWFPSASYATARGFSTGKTEIPPPSICGVVGGLGSRTSPPHLPGSKLGLRFTSGSNGFNEGA